MCVEVIVCYISVVFLRHSVVKIKKKFMAAAPANSCIQWVWTTTHRQWWIRRASWRLYTVEKRQILPENGIVLLYNKTRSIWKMFLGPFATASRFTLSFTRCRYCRHCRTPPAHQCPRRRRRRRRQRQRVTEGTAMAPWNGPNNKLP